MLGADVKLDPGNWTSVNWPSFQINPRRVWGSSQLPTMTPFELIAKALLNVELGRSMTTMEPCFGIRKPWTTLLASVNRPTMSPRALMPWTEVTVAPGTSTWVHTRAELAWSLIKSTTCADVSLDELSSKVATATKPIRRSMKPTCWSRFFVLFNLSISFFLSSKAQNPWANWLAKGSQLEIETIPVWAVLNKSVLTGGNQRASLRR